MLYSTVLYFITHYYIIHTGMKEMIAQREALEEEERQERKLEKEQILKEAARLKEEMAEARRVAAEKKKEEKELESKLQAEEEERLAEERRQQKAERQARRRAKAEAKMAAAEKEKQKFERRVINDQWTQEQQLALEAACLEFVWHMDRTERWNAIKRRIPPSPADSNASNKDVVYKTRNQCLRRYKYLKQLALAQQEEKAENKE